MESIKGNVKVKNIPAYIKTMENVLGRWAEAKKVKTGDLVVTVTIEKPFRPRTTGYKSQNHALNGYIQQICMDTGQDFGTTKNYIKQMAIAMGYPRKTRKLPNGCVVRQPHRHIGVRCKCAGLLPADRMCRPVG